MPRLTLLLSALLILTAGCGSEREREPVPAREPADGAMGSLVVHKAIAGSPIFTEGSLTRLRITGQDGRRVETGPPGGSLDAPLFEQDLPAGTYTVDAVERPCDGNCGLLDPPIASTRCTVAVQVEPGRATHVDIRLRFDGGHAVSRCRAR